MQQQLDKIKEEVTKRVYKLFMAKFAGNKLQFAKAAGCDEKTLEETAKALPSIQAYIQGKELRKVIVIKDKFVNLVV